MSKTKSRAEEVQPKKKEAEEKASPQKKGNSKKPEKPEQPEEPVIPSETTRPPQEEPEPEKPKQPEPEPAVPQQQVETAIEEKPESTPEPVEEKKNGNPPETLYGQPMEPVSDITQTATEISIHNASANDIPEYQSPGASGLDLRANLPHGFVRLAPGQRKLIPTGIYLDIPEGKEAQVRPRSGMANKQGLTVLNAPGTIDSDFKGEVMVNIINHSRVEQIIRDKDRIAQLVFASVEKVKLRNTALKDFTQTKRGTAGHGSTGR